MDGGPAALQFVGVDALHLVVTDLKMSPMDGLELLAEIRRREPQLPVLLMTAFGDVEKAVAAMRGGACDFLMKPFEPAVLLEHIDRYAMLPPNDDGLVAEDLRTRNLLGLAARVAASEATVLLSGESGTGKEVFARYIHQHSPRAGGPFVAINCAAIPENLLEATLFGFEKGAFTGAQNAQPGKFEQAEGGTLLLDEISEMPLALQAKLLRVLQEREVERVGGKKAIPLFPSACSPPPTATWRARCARRALPRGSVLPSPTYSRWRFRRCASGPPTSPPWRPTGRPGGGTPAGACAGCRRGGNSCRPHLARQRARTEWNTMERALILAPGESVGAEHIALTTAMRGTPAAVPAALAEMPAVTDTPKRMKDLEREHILATLAAVGGSRRKAVEKLGISERTLRYKLAQWRDEGVFEESGAGSV